MTTRFFAKSILFGKSIFFTHVKNKNQKKSRLQIKLILQNKADLKFIQAMATPLPKFIVDGLIQEIDYFKQVMNKNSGVNKKIYKALASCFISAVNLNLADFDKWEKNLKKNFNKYLDLAMDGKIISFIKGGKKITGESQIAFEAGHTAMELLDTVRICRLMIESHIEETK